VFVRDHLRATVYCRAGASPANRNVRLDKRSRGSAGTRTRNQPRKLSGLLLPVQVFS
jgi:hypothetical protein